MRVSEVVFVLITLGHVSRSIFTQPQRHTFQTQCPEKMDADILILGAGMTGLSAAKTLSDNGTKNFLIFEAEDQIGGRVKSIVLEKSGTRVELGANWIEEIDPSDPYKHPLWSLAEKCGGVDGFFQKDPSENASLRAYDSNGKNITSDPAFLARLHQWQQLFEEIITHSKYLQEHNLPDISVREALNMKGWVPNSPIDDLIEWIGWDWDYASPPDNASLKQNLPETTFGNTENATKWKYFITDQKTGYIKVLNCLAQEFLFTNDKRLHLNSTVRSVQWGDDCVCIMTMENNTLKQYCAPYAIITFSIGVLKNDSILFKPPLPQSKLNSMSKLSDAFYLKIIMEFEKIFWETDVDYILHADAVRGSFVHIQSLARYPVSHSSVIIVTVTGKNAMNVYKQEKDKTVESIMRVLRKIYGKAVTDPLNVVIPDWGINPYFRGMFSLARVGITGHDYDVLNSPLGQLYFGGEAISDCCSAFVHGAYLSGIDVANDVLKNKQ